MYSTENQLRVCKKQGWTVQVLQWSDGEVHTTIVVNRDTRYVAEADTPQDALRTVIVEAFDANT